MNNQKEIFIISPFEFPDLSLARAAANSITKSVLHLGRDLKLAENSLEQLSEMSTKNFGVFVQSKEIFSLKMPSNVEYFLMPYSLKKDFICSNISHKNLDNCYFQVFSIDQANTAIQDKEVNNIILKGNESSGTVANESSFILFQSTIEKAKSKSKNLFVQGGMGVHNSAAMLALGAKGVVFDSQVVLFPECSAPTEIKKICSNLSGTETKIIGNCRVLIRPNSPNISNQTSLTQLEDYFGGLDIEKNILPLGQDVALAADLYKKYKKLDCFTREVLIAAEGHRSQETQLKSLRPGNELAKSLNIKYPIFQGPMARVSDVPSFAVKVAEKGALPFIAYSLMKGDAAEKLLEQTKQVMGERTWGVGILGFAPLELRKEQTQYILKHKPSVLIIAGGRPSIAKVYQENGINCFLHVPSANLLSSFLKEGAKNFIFEGRESGGHVGPLSSMVLWEKQLNVLLEYDDPQNLSVVFAGGICNSISSAFISIMCAPLSFKGAKIGILMGSAYLFTQEAVESGAITKTYQNESIKHTKTVLLEAAPGQETRALNTKFSEYFFHEKKRLEDLKIDPKEIWFKLEQLNIGRLRIASKGVDRMEQELINLNEKEQLEKGVYMIGQVASLIDKPFKIEDLHLEVTTKAIQKIEKTNKIHLPKFKNKHQKIAIVGMACIYPGSKNLEEYWANILQGKNLIQEVPKERWNCNLFYNPDTKDTDYVPSKWGGFIPKIHFDPLEFGMPPQSVASIEPSQLLSLFVAKEALKDAGYENLAELDKENASIIFGTESSSHLTSYHGFRAYAKQILGDLPEELKDKLPKLTEDSFAGILSNVVSGRIANRLDFGGRNFTVDAACASSLAALKLGIDELIMEESNIVLLGGTDLHNNVMDYLMFNSTHALSKKGRCASFDSEADGIALGEGVSVVILKRLEDAKSDGNKIYAVINSIAGSSDGKSLGMTAPNRQGQIRAIKRAYQKSDLSPSEVELIEAHGTGTVVGDRTEMSALSDVLIESGVKIGQTSLGSVKTQIGHTKCAAGLAGLIKAALSIHYGILPPTINLNKPIPFYSNKLSPFVFHLKANLWSSKKRVAGVSAFGFGGTNFHTILESDNSEINENSASWLWTNELIVVRAKSISDSKIKLEKVQNILALNSDKINLRDIAYTLATDSKDPVQISFVVSSLTQLSEKINAILNETKDSKIYFRTPVEGKVAFLFSGQGSQRLNMARDLMVVFPAMRSLLLNQPELKDILYPKSVFEDQEKQTQLNRIIDTRNAQPLLGIVDLAIARLLNRLGIEPDFLIGHSYGEIPALCYAGAFEDSQLVEISRKRAQSILDGIQQDKGMMVASSMPIEELKKEIEHEKEIWIVNYNSRKQSILAGSTLAIQALIKKMSEKKITLKPLPVDCAFHSPLLSKAETIFYEHLKKIKFDDLTNEKVWSNTVAEPYPKESESIKKRLAEHLVKPVYFYQEIEKIFENGARIFIETGPGNVLTNLTKTILSEKESVITLSTEDKREDGIGFFLNTLGRYLSTGKELNFNILYDDRNVRSINFDSPESYAIKPTTWIIDGQKAVPVNAKMPTAGYYPIETPIYSLKNLVESSKNTAGTNFSNQSNNCKDHLDNRDQVVLKYLEGLNAMIQNQRDVMVEYLSTDPSGLAETTSPIQLSPSPTINPSKPTHQNLQDFDSSSSSSTSKEADNPSINSKNGFSRDQIKNLLIKTVSEKTGYPDDMLGLDLDLEADLSIDSIKRIEIISSLNNQLQLNNNLEESEELVEKLASIKTLNEFIDWMLQITGTNFESEKIQIASSSDNQACDNEILVNLNSTSTAVLQKRISKTKIQKLLIQTVVEKTGYPEEMLGLDLDLEADLSIDSIKRIEIISALNERLDITKDLEESEEVIEKLSTIKTLNAFVDWIEEIANAELPNVPDNENIIATNELENLEHATKKQHEISLPQDSYIPQSLQRGVFKFQEWVDPQSKNLSIINKHFLILETETGLGRTLKSSLEVEGSSVEISLLGSLRNPTKFDGLILLYSSESKKLDAIKELFKFLKTINFSTTQWIYVISDETCALANAKNLSELSGIQGFNGFIKSLSREYTKTNFRTIFLNQYLKATSDFRFIIDELKQTDQSCEIFYQKFKRMRLSIHKCSLEGENLKKNLDLNFDSVVLVLGGAQGITAELTKELSKRCPCTYILVGRTQIPKTTNLAYLNLKTKEQIKEYLIRTENMKIPAEIEKAALRIEKQNRIKNSIDQIKKSGSRVEYFSLDVSNLEQFKALLEKIISTYKKIDGIIHASGILIDKFFKHKDFNSFENVYNTKVNALCTILNQQNLNLKFLIFFSSVASVYGNRGQCDYSSANSVYDLCTKTIQDTFNIRSISFNWGPWSGAGMVSSSLEKEFKKRGIQTIPINLGAKYFVDELIYGNENQVLFTADKEIQQFYGI